MTKKTEKRYVDIRLTVEFDTETYELDGETFTERYMSEVTPSVQKVKNLSRQDLYGMAEAFGQTDRYQEMLVNKVTNIISDHADDTE